MSGFELYAPRTARHRRTWTIAIPILGVVFMILSGLIISLPFIIDAVKTMQAHPELAGKPMPRPHMAVWQLLLPDGITILLICLWVWLFERRPSAAIGFNSNGVWRFVRGYLIGCGFLLAVIGIIWGMGGYTVEGPGAWQAPTLAIFLPILGYLGLFAIQGSSEEVLMRGWLMGTISSRHGIVWAVIINSIIFGAMHLGNIKPSPAMWAGVSNVALFGVFISLYATHERSLWGVCGWHGAWNWLLGLGFGLEVSGIKMDTKPLVVDLVDKVGAPWWLSGAEWGPEASVVTTGVLLVGIIFLLAKSALKPGESFAAPEIADIKAAS